ncbi:MAG: 2-vinyl bacteriochlorophyllide hydratase [Pseudomonadota bacterium]
MAVDKFAVLGTGEMAKEPRALFTDNAQRKKEARVISIEESAITTKSETKNSSPLYTPEERKRRDETPWTVVQGVLAPLQFLVFLVSLVLVINFLINGSGLQAAVISVVAKTLVLYAIMVTGAIWEKAVFGCYLFAPAFFWEDVISMGVIALHTAYLLCWLLQIGSPTQQLWIAVAAYAAYVINAVQFLLKLLAAKSQTEPDEANGTIPMALQGALE